MFLTQPGKKYYIFRRPTTLLIPRPERNDHPPAPDLYSCKQCCELYSPGMFLTLPRNFTLFRGSSYRVVGFRQGGGVKGTTGGSGFPHAITCSHLIITHATAATRLTTKHTAHRRAQHAGYQYEQDTHTHIACRRAYSHERRVCGDYVCFRFYLHLIHWLLYFIYEDNET